jgi:hypothetical protein
MCMCVVLGAQRLLFAFGMVSIVLEKISSVAITCIYTVRRQIANYPALITFMRLQIAGRVRTGVVRA